MGSETVSEAPLTGGCQCGAVRFRAKGASRASICHCRMCQKAFGSPFGALVYVEAVEWTRAEPKRFQSSNVIKRGFCGDCGTPLTYEFEGGIDLAICAFDNPAALPPLLQLDKKSAIPWCENLASLPERGVEAQQKAELYQSRLVSFQHPDHEETDWKPRK